MNARARLLLTALALVASISLRVTAADAFQGMSEIRALTCCEEGCKHAGVPGTAARCCGVEREGQKITGAAAVKLPPVSWVAVSSRPLVPTDLALIPGASRVAESPPVRGEPVFLLTRVLRI